MCTKSGEFYYNEIGIETECRYCCIVTCAIGEIHSDFGAKKYLEKVTSDQVHLPPKHLWLLELYNMNESYIMQW